MDFALLISIAAGLSLAMMLAWAVQRATGSSGWIDMIWSFAVGAGGVAAAIFADGDAGRRATVFVLIAIWSVRLGGHIGARTKSGGEDPRYAKFLAEWGASAAWKLFVFLQVQALAALVLVLAVGVAAGNPAPFPRLLDMIGIVIATVAIGGEALADAELARFREGPGAKTGVCESGLWRYSRHPNYFFEWFGWCAWLFFAVDPGGAFPWGWLAIPAPALMYWLLVHVSGIPPLEEHMLQSRGEKFRALQRRVNAFFPGPRHSGGNSLRRQSMNMLAFAVNAAERAPLPDNLTLAGIDFLCRRTRRRLSVVPPETEAEFARAMQAYPVALHAEAANAQHYELPPEFFALVLGPQRKYSSCLYPAANTTLAEAERFALAETVTHADIKNGQAILELGCGWGSLSLYLARHFPEARIISVSNSASQRTYIEGQARLDGLTNLSVITADMNVFATDMRFDRIVSVEMFEHMSNWRLLLERARGWLKDDGKMFLHVFTHRDRSYRFNHTDPADWIAQHFFTGGIMPAFDLPRRFGDIFSVEQEWRWSGLHYRKTALDWLANFDRQAGKVDAILKTVCGADAALWRRRWRLFFLATAGLFGHADGDIWGVGHYLLAPAGLATEA